MREPIIIPRAMLAAMYGLFVVLGIVSGVAGIPTLSITTWRGYTSFWAAGLTLAALAALIGSIRERWEALERWGSVALVSLLSAYTFGSVFLTFDPAEREIAHGRAAFSIVLIILLLVPASRATSLLTRTGLRHE